MVARHHSEQILFRPDANDADREPRKNVGDATPPRPHSAHATGAMECLLGPCAGPGHGGVERYAAEVTVHSVKVRVASRRVAVILALSSVSFPSCVFPSLARYPPSDDVAALI